MTATILVFIRTSFCAEPVSPLAESDHFGDCESGTTWPPT